MNRICIVTLWLTAFVLCMISACGYQKSDQEKITIATAANMNYAMKELSAVFTQKTGIKCDLVVSSSGKLSAQIIEGAPYDVFVSADMKYPNEIFRVGLTQHPPKIYAYGELVLWTMKEGITPSMASLTKDSIEHIAVANPKTAPYGHAAIAALNNFRIFDAVSHKLVYGESISQTNQFIISRAADLGFTAMSVVLSPEMKGKGRWIALDEEYYPPIRQGVVVIERKKGNRNHTQKFYDFLFSAEAKKLLKKFGYSVDE